MIWFILLLFLVFLCLIALWYKPQKAAKLFESVAQPAVAFSQPVELVAARSRSQWEIEEEERIAMINEVARDVIRQAGYEKRKAEALAFLAEVAKNKAPTK
jgi:hypothetical protein